MRLLKELKKLLINIERGKIMQEVKINDFTTESSKTFIIAEAGSNHGGNYEQAKELVDVAVEAGADAVKFQSYEGESLVASDHGAYDVLDKYGLPYEWHQKLEDYCDSKGIIFCSSPFDYEKLDWLEEVDVPFIKVASGDLTYLPFIKKIAELGKPIVMSTGMATLGEVEESVNLIKAQGNEQIILLHCVGKYPTETDDANLNVMNTMKEALDLPVGFSDHTESTVIPAMAVSMGAKVIEKHFTLDKELDTPDHSFALSPNELKEMISNIRLAEDIKGSKLKRPTQSEIESSRVTARRSIHTKVAINKGEKITEDKLKVIRPAEGIEPAKLEEVLGCVVNKDLPAEATIKMSDIDWS